MRNIFKGLAMALALGGAMAASVPAEARRDGWHRHGDHRGWDRGRRWDGDRGWRGGRHYGYRGYHGPRYRGYYGPRYRYYAPRYGYGYGYGYPRYRYYRDHDNSDALIAGIAGLAIGAAIASADDY